ncbi:MAG TPA: hypothetical protein VNI20_01250 [Fimbriimonadaceae bacterium]|nr:hypothetical protein [Fimbriimonadaceae bacterium]
MRTLKSLIVPLAVFVAAVSGAQSLPYAQNRRTINAGTLLIESQRIGVPSQPADIAPHLWFNLARDSVNKPASWTFDNPLGQSTMTADAYNRWIVNPSAGTVPAVGTQLNKSSAAYWEISLASASDDALSQFDILNLTVNGTLSLNSVERDKLRRYLDQGGILWVDLVNDASLGIDIANGLPYGFDWTTSALPIQADFDNPVLRSPNPIRFTDLAQMSYNAVLGPVVTTPVDLSTFAVSPLLSWVDADSRRLESVAGNNDGRIVSVAQLGEGYLVITARGVTATLNRGVPAGSLPPITPQPNRGFFALDPVFDNSFASAAKFAVNVVSLATNFSTSSAGSRRSGGSAVTVEAPLLRRFTANFGGGSFDVNKPAVLFKGYAITTAGGRISVFDADPGRDIDHDGDPDDGVPDPLGAGTDLIWQSPILGGKLSSPTVVEAPDTTLFDPITLRRAVNQIWVVDSASNVYVFNLDAQPGFAVASLTPPIGPPNGELPAIDPNGPFPPTIQEGIVLIADSRATDNLGRLWAIDLNTATRITSAADWSIRGTGQFNASGAPATLGYIPMADNPGGLDRVVYVPQQPTSLGTPRPASLTSFWLGARGETPVRVLRISPTQVRITTRASQQGLPLYFAGPSNSLGMKITLLKPNGDPFSIAEMQTIFTGNIIDPGTKGELVVELTNAPGTWDFDGQMTPGDPTDDVGWRIDYTIDWGQIGVIGGTNAQSYIRGNLELPDTVANTRRIVGAAAMGPDGNLFVETGGPNINDIGSTLFNFREVGRGDFKLVYRYDLYDRMTFHLNQGTTKADAVNMPASIVDEDNLLTDMPFLNTPISFLKFVGGPTVRGDTVYCTAVGRKLINVSTSVVLAFKANPGPLQFEVAGEDTGFILMQPDISRSVTKTAPTTFSTLRQQQFTAEKIPGQNRTRIIIDSAMTTTRGRIGDSISSSLPIIVRRNGQTDTLVEPETPTVTSTGAYPGNARGRYDPLLWFMVLNGYESITPPVVTGDTMYMAGASILPSLIVNGQGGPFQQNGLMWAMDANISPTDPFLKVNTDRPWQEQLSTVVKASPAPGDFTTAPAIKWPQFKGARDFDDIRVRILQATLPEQRGISLAVGDDALIVTGDQNLYGFTRSDFTVVDEGRVSTFDTSGNPLWSSTQTVNAGLNVPVSGATTGVRLSRPTRMYPDPLGTDSFWIVDSGNDRVTNVDRTGRELRTITEFKLDPQFVPPGMGDSETTKLRDPRDIYVYETRVDAANNAMSNPQPLELWKHYLIAEAGNHRVIEIVDRYAIDTSGRILGIVQYNDPNTGVQNAIGVLSWHTPEELSGKRFAYNSIAETFVDDGSGGKRRVVGLGFGNVEPGRATVGLDSNPQDLDVSSGYGGVILYDGASSLVVKEFAIPSIPGGAYLEETAPGSGMYDFLSAPVPAEQEHKIAGLRSLSMRYISTVNGPRLSLMVTEATGVYEIVQPDLAQPDMWAVNWMMTNKAYQGMRRPRSAAPYTLAQLADNPQKFQPQYSRRLDSGEVLIVNGYLGALRDGRGFDGEVFLADGRIGGSGNDPGYDVSRPDLGFNSLSVVYELPPVQGIRGIVRPVYAERQ